MISSKHFLTLVCGAFLCFALSVTAFADPTDKVAAKAQKEQLKKEAKAKRQAEKKAAKAQRQAERDKRLAEKAKIQAEKDKEVFLQPTALFGVGISFTDSVVYQTEVQELDTAWITKTHKFLMDRSLYSLQLQFWMEQQGVKNSICTVLFDKKKNRLQKKWNKISKRHQQNEAQRFKVVPLSDFRFKTEEYRPITIGDDTP